MAMNINTEQSGVHVFSTVPFVRDYEWWLARRKLLATYYHAKQRAEGFKKMVGSTRRQNKNVTHSTAGVNLSRLKKWQAKNKCFGKPVCVEITKRASLGPLLCHVNAEFVQEHLRYKHIMGFNVTACPCKQFMSFEFHSCNVQSAKKFLDWTEDFNGETHKYFLPIKRLLTAQEVMTVNSLEDSQAIFSVGRDKCKCGVNWNVGEVPEFNKELFKQQFE